MTVVDTRMPRAEAIAIARQFVAEIEPYTTQLIVAGSLRRRLAFVHDIEIVAVPKVERVAHPVTDLFGESVEYSDVDRLAERLNELHALEWVEKRLDANGSPRWGPTLKYLTYQGARVDLFTPCTERLGWILLLRTGPAQFSRQLVLPRRDDRGRELKTKDTRPGLMPTHIRAEGGWLTWRTSGERIETRTEHDVFELFKLPYREPWERM